MTVEKVDHAIIARQQDSLPGEMRTMREDMTAMMEILRRVSTDVSSLGAQLTTMHSYNRRVEERVRKLEDVR